MKRQIAGLERGIAEMEERLREIDEALCRQETLSDSGKVQKLMIERDDLDKRLKDSYAGWEEMSLRLEDMKE